MNQNPNEKKQKNGYPQIEVMPAILPQSFQHLSETISRVKNAVTATAGYIQIDVVDGVFAPSKTWPYNDEELASWERIKKQEDGLPSWETLNYEIDLMVMDQLGASHNWISAGASRLIGHIEAFDKNFIDEMTLEEYTEISGASDYVPDLNEEDLEEFLELREGFGVEIVMSLNPATGNKTIEPFLDRLDGVQFMGNDKIGFHGVDLNKKVIDKIVDLRAKAPTLPIGIDIGVNFKTLTLLADAGVTRFASGSTILKSENPRETILDMLKVIDAR